MEREALTKPFGDGAGITKTAFDCIFSIIGGPGKPSMAKVRQPNQSSTTTQIRLS